MGYTYGGMMADVIAAVNRDLNLRVASCVDSAMVTEIDRWAMLYANEAEWLKASDGVYSAGIAGGIAAEIARLATLEMQSTADAPAIDAAYQLLISNIRRPVELGVALGGVIFKPYIDAAGRLASQFIRADRFFPLSFDSSGDRMTGCVLVEQAVEKNAYYNRLEVYFLDGSGGVVYNLAYRSHTAGILGTHIELEEYAPWASYVPRATFSGARLPFGYFKMPIANPIDPDSPLGVSIYARAALGSHCLLKEADLRYSNECWEYEATQAAVHIAESMLKMNDDGSPQYPQRRNRLYRALQYSAGAADKPLLDSYSPEIRDASIASGYNRQLQKIEFVCGLAYGTISDPRAVEKTATEVRASKQRLYATVTDVQKALEAALEDYAAGAALLLGAKPPVMAFTWDDSIMVDSESLQRSKLLEFSAGLIDAVKYFMDVYGMDQDVAVALVAEMEARKPKPALMGAPGADDGDEGGNDDGGAE